MAKMPPRRGVALAEGRAAAAFAAARVAEGAAAAEARVADAAEAVYAEAIEVALAAHSEGNGDLTIHERSSVMQAAVIARAAAEAADAAEARAEAARATAAEAEQTLMRKRRTRAAVYLTWLFGLPCRRM